MPFVLRAVGGQANFRPAPGPKGKFGFKTTGLLGPDMACLQCCDMSSRFPNLPPTVHDLIQFTPAADHRPRAASSAPSNISSGHSPAPGKSPDV